MSLALATLLIGVLGFEKPGGGLLVERPETHPDPNDVSHWVHVNDAQKTCSQAWSEFLRRAREPEGLRLGTPEYKVYFLANEGQLFVSDAGGSTWTPLGQGRWLPKTLTWSKSDGRVVRRLAWQSGTHEFLNDPRTGFEKRWYQVGPGRVCHVFEEGARTYGPADIQTVTLESGVPGVPGWTLTTGEATVGEVSITGNWLD